MNCFACFVPETHMEYEKYVFKIFQQGIVDLAGSARVEDARLSAIRLLTCLVLTREVEVAW